MLLNTNVSAKKHFTSYFVFGRGVQSYPCCLKLPQVTVVDCEEKNVKVYVEVSEVNKVLLSASHYIC